MNCNKCNNIKKYCSCNIKISKTEIISDRAGRDGESAFEIARRLGAIPLSWTEQDYLDSLKGKNGERGPIGPPGPPGDSVYLDCKWCNLDTDIEEIGNPDTKPELWSENSTDAIFMALRKIENNVESDWDVIKTKGDKGLDGSDGKDGQDGKDGLDGKDGQDGKDGSTKFLSIVFKRSNTDLSSEVPTGGDFNNPIPTTSGWFDTIPAGTEPIWMSSRYFSNTPGESDPEWSTPRLLVDSETTDFEWSDSTNENPGTPSVPLNGAVWKNDPNELFNPVVYMAVRYRASTLDSWGQWIVTRVKGEKGDPGENGTAPIAIDRGDYNSMAVYTGSTERIDMVHYNVGGVTKLFIAKTTAGTFSGIPPTDTSKWDATEIEALSINTQILNATSAAINTLSARRVSVLDSVNIPRTTIGMQSDSSGSSDPTKGSAFDIAGLRQYHASGRIAMYMGVVNGFTYTDSSGSKTVNGWAIITFKDESSSPVFFVLDSYTASGGIQYVTVSGASWVATDVFRLPANFQGVSPSTPDGSDFNDIFTSNPNTRLQEVFKGSLSYELLSGDISITASDSYQIRIPAGDEPDQRVKYVTTQNGNTAIPDGWYFVNEGSNSMEITVVNTDPSTGSMYYPTFVGLRYKLKVVYITDGYITNTVTIDFTTNTETTSPAKTGAPLGTASGTIIRTERVEF